LDMYVGIVWKSHRGTGPAPRAAPLLYEKREKPCARLFWRESKNSSFRSLRQWKHRTRKNSSVSYHRPGDKKQLLFQDEQVSIVSTIKYPSS
jgi:hypothetical protein